MESKLNIKLRSSILSHSTLFYSQVVNANRPSEEIHTDICSLIEEAIDGIKENSQLDKLWVTQAWWFLWHIFLFLPVSSSNLTKFYLSSFDYNWKLALMLLFLIRNGPNDWLYVFESSNIISQSSTFTHITCFFTDGSWHLQTNKLIPFYKWGKSVVLYQRYHQFYKWVIDLFLKYFFSLSNKCYVLKEIRQLKSN